VGPVAGKAGIVARTPDFHADHSAGPASTTPAGMRGAPVWLIAPATFFTSLGLIEAAITRTNAALLVGSRGGNLGHLKSRGIAEGLEPCRAHGPLLQVVIYVSNLIDGLPGFKECSNLHGIDGEIPRDLLDCEAHIGQRVERRALDWPANPFFESLLQQILQFVSIA
jgi:hypothetical protein